jgi:hypothetical protein
MTAVDALVRGKLGIHDKVVEGRVISTARSGAVAVIRTDNQRQAIIYEPEQIGEPRPMAARRDIPERFK